MSPSKEKPPKLVTQKPSVKSPLQIQAPLPPPPWGLYLEGRFNEGFLRYEFGGLLFGGAHT